MKTFSSVLVGLCAASLMAACAPQKQNVTAPSQIGDGFSVQALDVQPMAETPAAAADIGHDKFNLVLKKGALEKEYFLSASIIPQTGAATSGGLAGRVVAFKQVGNSVFLLEATQGHVVTDDLPATLILAEIPVLKQDADSLTLDFNAGMKKVFVADNWYVSDYGGKKYVRNDKALEVTHSFIEKMELKNNRLEIRQIAQFKVIGSVFPTNEVRYYLEPYKANPNFKPIETSKFKSVGFFEVPAVLESGSGRSTVRASKWDDSKPIVFHVSANTPADYVDAVKEGILYWNKAFGRDVMKAEVAPKGVTAPDPNYNLVQWVPWDTAGFAYADALMDPRTGEIKHAQAYMTSVFALSGKIRARRLLRQLQLAAEAKPKKDGNKALLATKFMHPSRVCDYDMSAKMVNALEEVIALDADDATVLRISQDFVRQVVAHEVGHTLGLRHNFAANLSADHSLKEVKNAYHEYVAKNKIADPEKISVISSVMEYATFADDVVVASQFSQMKKALAYDSAAIAWAYQGKVLDRKTTPLFCTDSHVGKFADCQRFDAGKNPVEHNIWAVEEMLSGMPTAMVEKYITAKAPMDARDVVPVEEVSLKPAAVANEIGVLLKGQLAWLKTATRSLSIERSLPFVGPLNEDEINKLRLKGLESQIAAVGGLDRVLFALLPNKIKWKAVPDKMASLPTTSFSDIAKKKLEEYLKSDTLKEFVGLDGKKHSFKAQELEVIKKMGGLYFDKVEELALQKQLEVLAAAKIDLDVKVKGSIEEKSLSAQMEKRLAELAEILIMTEDKEKDPIIGKVKLGAGAPRVAVNRFKFKPEVRMQAVKLLSGGLSPVSDFSAEGNEALTKKLVKHIETSLGSKIKEIKLENLSRSLRQWYVEQRQIVRILTKLRGGQ